MNTQSNTAARRDRMGDLTALMEYTILVDVAIYEVIVGCSSARE